MSNTFDEFSNAIAEETLIEMADSFFGARKTIDDDKDHFCEQAKMLFTQCELALQRSALLHALLLTPENILDFYDALAVNPGCLAKWIDPDKAQLEESLPLALTTRGRYVRLVYQAYKTAQDAFDEYMHGRYYSVPGEQGRKRLSLHYHLLRDWAGHINRRIRNVNEGMAPSCVLGFAKSMDHMEVEREKITGATLEGYACTLDHDLAISPVSCEEVGLRELPELPPPNAVKNKIMDFAGELYEPNKKHIKQLLCSFSKKGAPESGK